MIEYLEEIDRSIVVAVNSWHSPFLDEFMWWISARITWIPLYIILIYLAFRKLKIKQFFFFILLAVLAVVLTDLISVHLFKNVFLRYRPSHNLLITNQLHYYRMNSKEVYMGGEYGFVSSHAANYFAIATSSILVLRKYYSKLWIYLLICGVLICLSRIYLGVHYLSDVIVGGLVGFLMAFLLYKYAYKKLSS